MSQNIWNATTVIDRLGTARTSIEILPGGLKEWESTEVPSGSPNPSQDFPFLLVEGNLGIPKKILCALYLAATSMPWHRSSDIREITATTSCIILLNPAHQTALNSRKRLIRDGHLDLEKELIFTELLLRGSPECAKQSIIWDHRRWCFRELYGVMGPKLSTVPPCVEHWSTADERQTFPKITSAAIQHELNIIQHTCQTYPRNYHAWAYWHFIIDVCHASIYYHSSTADRDEPEHLAGRRQDFLDVIIAECTRLRGWVESNVSDYSAMHQLCQIQKLVEQLLDSGTLVPDSAKNLTSLALADQSLSLATAFPSHESLWMYLRTSLAAIPAENRTVILEKIRAKDASITGPFVRWPINWFAKI